MLYTVHFDVRFPGQINHMVYHCMAQTASEAKASVRNHWSRLCLGSDKGRARNLCAKRSDVQDIPALRVTGWEGTVYSGAYVVGHVFCTGYTNAWGRRARA